MSEDNTTLAAKGLDERERLAFWDDKFQRQANDKTDTINRQQIKDGYTSAIASLDTIIAGPVGNDKTLATILKKLLLYLRSEIQ